MSDDLPSAKLMGRTLQGWRVVHNPRRLDQQLTVPYQGESSLPLEVMVPRWEIYLRACNRSPKTIRCISTAPGYCVPT